MGLPPYSHEDCVKGVLSLKNIFDRNVVWLKSEDGQICVQNIWRFAPIYTIEQQKLKISKQTLKIHITMFEEIEVSIMCREPQLLSARSGLYDLCIYGSWLRKQ